MLTARGLKVIKMLIKTLVAHAGCWVRSLISNPTRYRRGAGELLQPCYFTNWGPDSQNILRQSYDNLTILPKLSLA